MLGHSMGTQYVCTIFCDSVEAFRGSGACSPRKFFESHSLLVILCIIHSDTASFDFKTVQRLFCDRQRYYRRRQAGILVRVRHGLQLLRHVPQCAPAWLRHSSEQVGSLIRICPSRRSQVPYCRCIHSMRDILRGSKATQSMAKAKKKLCGSQDLEHGHSCEYMAMGVSPPPHPHCRSNQLEA